MSETKFPEGRNGSHYWTCYDPDEVDDWFKRCKNDRPHPNDFKTVSGWGFAEVEWFRKWFSQFEAKDE